MPFVFKTSKRLSVVRTTPTLDVPLALSGEGATGHQIVLVHMMSGHGLSPGMQGRGHAQLAVEAFGIGGESTQGGPYRFNQQGIDPAVVNLYPAIVSSPTPGPSNNWIRSWLRTI